jgi:hypothetical protein
MTEYLYLYRGGEQRPGVSPEEMQKRMAKWMNWVKDLESRGHLKDPGHPLESKGKVVKGIPKTITDGPFTEAKDLIGGFTIVKARDLDEAADLTTGCPIFDMGGFVEVRPLRQM